MIRARSQAREAALKALYQLDLRPDLSVADLEEEVRHDVRAADAREFALELLHGVVAQRDPIDREVEAVAHNWSLARMAAVDRNVLRLGAYELMHRPDVPPAVAINEAVTIAKKYSTAESGNFVNGILDQLRLRHRAEGGDPH